MFPANAFATPCTLMLSFTLKLPDGIFNSTMNFGRLYSSTETCTDAFVSLSWILNSPFNNPDGSLKLPFTDPYSFDVTRTESVRLPFASIKKIFDLNPFNTFG